MNWPNWIAPSRSRAACLRNHLRKVQNIYYGMLANVCPKFMNLLSGDGDQAHVWLAAFNGLGEKLGIAVPEIKLETNVEEPVCVQS